MIRTDCDRCKEFFDFSDLTAIEIVDDEEGVKNYLCGPCLEKRRQDEEGIKIDKSRCYWCDCFHDGGPEFCQN